MMKITRRSAILSLGAWVTTPFIVGSTASAQEGMGPFMPHNGLQLTTAWGNSFGPDAEAWITFDKVGTNSAEINYSSSRGMKAVRQMRAVDRQEARTLILGFNSSMPAVIENTTTLGISTAVFNELRSMGQARLDLIPDTSMKPMQGQLQLVEKSSMTVDMGGQQVPLPVLHVKGQFSRGQKRAEGDLFIMDNQNNPVIIEYSLNFAGEKVPRHERIVLVTPGAGMQSEMEQALATVREYVTRGIHFNFDKATIQAGSNQLLKDIAKTLSNNPLWTLQIAGHTDSIGDKAYNKKLSQKRAESVKAALVKRGVAPERLTTVGMGASEPVASNKTLAGRAQNRRVVLTRTDR